MSPGVFDLETNRLDQIPVIRRRENEAGDGLVDLDNALGLGQRAKSVRSANR